MDYSNTTTIVTGGSQGIGEATAEKIASLGGRVAIFDLDEERGRTVAGRIAGSGARSFFAQVDIRDEDAVISGIEAVKNELGPADVLINNAGINAYADPVKMTSEEWDRLFAVDLKGAFFCTKHCLPDMIAKKKGSIVNIASLHAKLTTPGMFPYAACKSGLVGMTRSLALEVGKHQIRANAVLPGYTRTRLVEEYFSKQPNPKESEEAVLKVHAMNRIATVQEIANVIAFVGSDEASFMTGAEVPVDGGLGVRFSP